VLKRIDKLILGSFLGPFILTFLVVVFILLTQHMLKYFDDIIGKDLGAGVIAQLLFYFAIFMTPVAMPLAVLLSSLITFGNLGEHFELTAIKASGISLLRTLRPIFFFVLLLTGMAFYANNNLVPKAALEAYSLLYDIKQKKPALDIKEGEFYNGIPDISIKVREKLDDGIGLIDVFIYDHRGRDGNTEVTRADSGRMYTILNDRYLKLELYNGFRYSEDGEGPNVQTKEPYSRSQFGRSVVVFDLSSFSLNRTDKRWFQGNRIMRNVQELSKDMDSVKYQIAERRLSPYESGKNMFAFHRRMRETAIPDELQWAKVRRDSLYKSPQPSEKLGNANDSTLKVTLSRIRSAPWAPELLGPVDSLLAGAPTRQNAQLATNNARAVKSQTAANLGNLELYSTEFRVFHIQWHKILASSAACVIMFLIGAPLGAIIKKGGLGVPVLVSIFFFIFFYLLSITGEKWAKQGLVPVTIGVWAANMVLLPVGLLFLRQARADSRLFDADAYLVYFDRLLRLLRFKPQA
jgi:lipopolysaccharide export system permease protein